MLGSLNTGFCVRADPYLALGVPWCHRQEPALHISRKSGNFGHPDFFLSALAILNSGSEEHVAGTGAF